MAPAGTRTPAAVFKHANYKGKIAKVRFHTVKVSLRMVHNGVAVLTNVKLNGLTFAASATLK